MADDSTDRPRLPKNIPEAERDNPPNAGSARSARPERRSDLFGHEEPQQDNSAVVSMMILLAAACFIGVGFIGWAMYGGLSADGSAPKSVKATASVKKDPVVTRDQTEDTPPKVELPPLAEQVLSLEKATIFGVAVPRQILKLQYQFAPDKHVAPETHLFLILKYPDDTLLRLNLDAIRSETEGNYQGDVTNVDSEKGVMLYVETGSATSDKRRRISNHLIVKATQDADLEKSQKPGTTPNPNSGRLPAGNDRTPPPLVVTQPAADDEVSKTLAELKNGSGFAADRLSQMTPTAEHKAEVVKTLTSMATTSASDGIRASAVRALAVWGGKEAVPTLVAKLQDKSPGVRETAIYALGDLKDVRAAQSLARFLPTDQGDHAAKALKMIGSAAESAVWPYLRYEEKEDTKKRACKLLEDIGTAASNNNLQTVIRREQGAVKEAAIKARDAIRNR